MDGRQYVEEEQLTVLKEEFYWICQGNESQSNSGNGSYKHGFYNSLSFWNILDVMHLTQHNTWWPDTVFHRICCETQKKNNFDNS